MIDCPICHVKNYDDARFCAECGQRLGGGQPQPGAPAPQAPAPQPPSGFRNAFESGFQQTNMTQSQQPAQPQPPLGEQSKTKLRSPLLAGEEFEDEEPYQPAAPASGRGLHSPLLGGGGSTGGGGLRSPLLGGGPATPAQDDYEQSAPSSGGLRSPLLGGGGGGAYGGTDRRQPSAAPYGGQERRKGGLRSPILGGGSDYDYVDDYEDDEPIDEDNPNVLRSPLLAAKRPVVDRPQIGRTPANSNAQMTGRNPAPMEGPAISSPTGSPTSSYTSLRSINSAAGPGQMAMPPAPHNAPNAVAPQSMPQAPQSMPQGPQPMPPQQGMRTFDPMSVSTILPANQMPPAGAQPTTVPSAFQSMQTGVPTGPAPSAESVSPFAAAAATPPAGTFATDIRQNSAGPSTGGGVNVQPPRVTPSAIDAHAEQLPKRGSKMFGASDDHDDYAAPAAGSRFAATPSAPPFPVPKIIGVVGILLLLLKFWTISQMMGTQWKDTPFLVVDQVIGLGVVICLIVLSFTSRN